MRKGEIMKNNTTQPAESEQEAKTLNRLINLLTALTIVAAAFAAGYYVAIARAVAMLNN